MTHHQIDTLLEDLEQTIAHLEQTRNELDSLHHELHQPLTIQWTPAHSPPRRITFEHIATGCTRNEYEWTGTEWRPCGSEEITDPAITPIHPLPEPTDPPTLEDLLEHLHRSPTHALVFEQTPQTDTGVVVSLDDELRFRSLDAECWYPIDDTDLQLHLQQYGQPTLTTLEDTPFDRSNFTSSPLADQTALETPE